MNYYNEIVKIITSEEKFNISLGLERISKVLESLDNPQNNLSVIHIAGTNGKGSVSAIVSNIMVCAGYKTGLYQSPHLVKYNERIRINNENIDDKTFYSLIKETLAACEKINVSLTEFEILTVVAFLYFKANKVDYVVLETGLGGRLDATNVVHKPILTIITSISLEHTERLGNTIEKIAFEKAGIIKNNVPCVVSFDNQGFNVIKVIAEKRKSQIIIPQKKAEIFYENKQNKVRIYDINSEKIYRFNLFGLYQEKNLELAYSTIKFLQNNRLKISEKAFEQGLNTVTHNGRFQYISNLNLLIDGAHNPDGAVVLKESVDKYFSNKKITWIYSSLKNKNFKAFLKTVLKKEDKIFIYTYNRSNIISAKDIEDIIKTKNIEKKDIKTIIENNLKDDSLTIITGSLYAIGDMFEEVEKI